MNMDRRTMVGVALCVLFLIFYRPLLHLLGWDKYLPSTAPVATAPRDTSHTKPGTSEPITSAPPASSLSGAARPSGGASAAGAGAPSGKPTAGSLFATPKRFESRPSELEQTFDL